MSKLPHNPSANTSHSPNNLPEQPPNPNAKLLEKALFKLKNIAYLGRGIDINGNYYSIFLLIQTLKFLIFPANKVGESEFWKFINKNGASIHSQARKTAFLTAIEQCDAQSTNPPMTIINETGFTPDKNGFALANHLYGKDESEAFILQSPENAELLAEPPRGSTEDWQSTAGQLAVGNSRLMFAFCLALFSILQGLIGGKHFMVSLVGLAGTGKTAIGNAASSMWCVHNDESQRDSYGFGKAFNSTMAQLGETFLKYSHLFLFIDETRSIPQTGKGRGHYLLDASMLHSTGKTKERMTNDSKPFFTPALVTANTTLADELGEDRTLADDAYFDRYIEIPAPKDGYGFFETIHGYASIKDFCKALVKSSHANGGRPVDEILFRYFNLSQDERAELVNFLEARRDAFIEKNTIAGYSRVVQRFADVYACGMLGYKLGVFNWERADIYHAIQKCLLDTIEFRKSFSPASRQELQGNVAKTFTQFITEHSDSFCSIGLNSGLVKDNANLDGYSGMIFKSKAGTEFLFTPSQFNRIFENVVKKGANLNSIKATLATKALILTANGNLDKERYSLKRTIGKIEAGTVWRENLIVTSEALIDGYQNS